MNSKKEEVRKVSYVLKFKTRIIRGELEFAQSEEAGIEERLKKLYTTKHPLVMRALCVDEDLWPLWWMEGRRGTPLTFQKNFRAFWENHELIKIRR